MIPYLLDNPAWSALTTEQGGFAQGEGKAKRYLPEVLPFAAIAPDGSAADLDPLMATGESFYLIGELPALPAHWVLELELPCAQLLAPDEPTIARGEATSRHGLEATGETIERLGPGDRDEMFRLIHAVQPGYYLPDTYRLGDYFGIRIAGRLVAMAGERLRMTGLSELSAVCTSPEYTGRGYAQLLMARLMERQREAGTQPFLHVSKANERALRLYEHLGFRRRRDISFWRIRKAAGKAVGTSGQRAR